MKRLGMLVAAVAVVLVTAVPAMAQQQNFTVTFGGQMRLFGLTWDNMTDFTDTGKTSKLFPTQVTGSSSKDSDSYYFQRWRLYTTVESADKKARVVWAIEVGDITWGLGGGASGDEFGTGTNSRAGNSTGGAFGADGVNVETKNLYLQFDIPWIPNSNILLGIHNIVWLASPAGNFLDDDAAGIQLNFKFDPVDLQLWTAKLDENARQSADDNDLWAARLGVNLGPDTRVTVEGLVRDGQCFARRLTTPAAGSTGPFPTTTAATPATATTPAVPGVPATCVSENWGDTYWIGATAGTKIAGITLHFSGVYGQRKLWSIPNQRIVSESGYGIQLIAQVPIGPLATWWQGWYTSGDKSRIAGGCPECVRAHPAATQPLPNLVPGLDFAQNAQSYNLVKNSDKLPVPDAGASWGNVPFVMEFMRGLNLIGAPGFGSPFYEDPTGTWGIGGSATYALTPAFSVGGGIGYMEASESKTTCVVTGLPGGAVTTACGGGIFGDHVIEFDGGAIWRYNPNLTITGIVGYAVPDIGDDAWGATFRTQFSF